MTTTSLDAPLFRHTGNLPTVPIAPGLAGARADVEAAARDLLALSDGALEAGWPWIGGGDTEVRYGAYRAYETSEQAAGEAEEVLRAAGVAPSRAARRIAPATASRWDLHGLLLPLTTGDWDGDAGGGEWTIRQTVGHIVNSQRAYAWATAWWHEQGIALDATDLPASTPESLWADLPDEHGPEAAGQPEEVRARLDTILDLSAERLAGLPDDRLALGSRWSDFAVPIEFRLGRWSSHIREHTIQVEKTLAMLGHPATEVERLVRLVLAGYGRLEAVVFGRPAGDVGPAVEVIGTAAAEMRRVAADVRATVQA